MTLGPDPGDFELEYLLNGVSVAKTQDAAPFTFADLPFGRQQLVVRIVSKAGLPLANPERISKRFIYLVKGCDTPSDCDDGHACSGVACVTNECRYGPIDDCCEHDLECAVSDTCVSGKCLDCVDASGCDDGDVCTIDACNAGSACVHTAIPGCCSAVSDCADGLACTTDSCDPDAASAFEACSHLPISGCALCTSPDACQDDSPCTL